ncbi:programmed cell death protein 4-like [Artemia franciscana]|uniref:Programmed cell death protein 4 n=1 Tax=Artemia franciscana TaxID=6661 RepID=A0AA88HX22_ARTSF|nr:hypothetical protein QYM36_011278 [Artemia franciscana]
MDQSEPLDLTSTEVEMVNTATGELQDRASSDPGTTPLDRPQRRAKRPSKHLIKLAKEHAIGKDRFPGPNTVRSIKNMRKSRTGYGRGLAKKGGDGGKGVWGKPGSELVPVEIDPEDPNYESDSFETKEVTIHPVVLEPSDGEINKAIHPVLLEYFDNGDTNEVLLAFEDIAFSGKKYRVVVDAIELSMDHKPSHREMISVLISDLYNWFLSERDIERGLDQLLSNLPDLVLDFPEAPVILGNFIGRFIADDCLYPRFIRNYEGKVKCPLAKQALVRADVLISMNHGMVRLDNVWGVGGGYRPVRSLIKAMNLILKEYVTSRDEKEAARCLKDLEVPHFHHELVYEAIMYVLDSCNANVEDLIIQLLKHLYDTGTLTYDQLKAGFQRVLDEIDDIIIDIPNVTHLLEHFAQKCKKAGVVQEELLGKIPVRGRKRFVSEGDKGVIRVE